MIYRYLTCLEHRLKNHLNSYTHNKRNICCEEAMERAGETRGKDKMTFLICMVATTFVSGVEMKLLRTSCKSEAEFSIILEGIYDSGSPLKKLSTPTRQKCLLHCQATLGCSSVNYKKVGGDCDLLSRNMTASKGLLQVKTGWEYISTNDYDQNVRNCIVLHLFVTPCHFYLFLLT